MSLGRPVISFRLHSVESRSSPMSGGGQSWPHIYFRECGGAKQEDSARDWDKEEGQDTCVGRSTLPLTVGTVDSSPFPSPCIKTSSLGEERLTGQNKKRSLLVISSLNSLVGHSSMGSAAHNYSWLILLVVVMFYKVVANAKLVNPETLLLGKIQDEVPLSLWSQTFHQPINP